MQVHHSAGFGKPTVRNSDGSYPPIPFHNCCGITHHDRNRFAIRSRSSSPSLADRYSEHSPYGPLRSLLDYFIFFVLLMVLFFLSFLVSPIRSFKLFLLFAIIGLTSTANSFNEWDFQQRQDTSGIVNESHSISGSAFTFEPPIVIIKALETLCSYMNFIPHYHYVIPNP